LKELRQPAALGVLALCTIAFSFLTTRYILRELGAAVQSDALFAGMTLPALFFEVITYSVAYVVLPLLATEEREQRRRDTWTLAQGVALIFTVLAAVLWFATPVWVPFMVSGFAPAAKALTIALTRIQLIGMVFNSVTVILSSYQYSRKRFVKTEASSTIAAIIGLVLLMKTLPSIGLTAVRGGNAPDDSGPGPVLPAGLSQLYGAAGGATEPAHSDGHDLHTFRARR
jgi:hypothetical protein